MTDLRTQVREYATRLDDDQTPVDAAEAMTRRHAVQELPQPRRIWDRAVGRAPRWAVTVALVLVAVSLVGVVAWLIGTQAESSPVGPATSLPATTTTVIPTTTMAPSPTTTVAASTTVPVPPTGLLPTVVDAASYGGIGFDYATAVAAVEGGGSVVAIDYRSSGDGDLVVARYSAEDELIWSRAWSTEREDSPMRGAIDTDSSGASFVGVTMNEPAGGDQDMALVKFDADGALVWQRAALDVAGGQRPHVVAVAEDGSVFVAGHTDTGLQSDPEQLFMMRVDTTGQLLWQKVLVGSGAIGETAFGGTVDASGNLVLAGTVGDYNDEVDALVAKVDPEGNVIWQRSWGVPGAPDRAWNVVTDPEDNIYISGPVFGIGDGGDQTFVVKIDPDGTLAWARIWQISGNELWSSGTAFGDGMLVVSGFIGRVDAGEIRMDKSAYLLGVSPDGELLWQAAIGARPVEAFESLAFASDGTLIAVGQGEGAEPNVVALSGEWLTSDLPLAETELTATALDLPWVEGGGEISDASGTVGGGSGADASVMRLDLP